VGGALALLWAAACIGPVPAIGQGPTTLQAPAPTPKPAPKPTQAPAALIPTPAPTQAPAPRPTAGPGDQALLQAVREDLATQWVKTTAETALRSGPDDNASLFTTLPQWSALKRLDSRGDWLKVYYGGDGDTREPGPGWVKASDVGAIGTPAVWLAAARPAALWADPTSSAVNQTVPATTRLQVVASDPIKGSRLHVQTPGDGRGTPPGEGWVEAGDATRSDMLPPGRIPWAFPDVIHATVRLPVQYRTQLDGSEYASANCGPTAVGMALEAFGVQVEPRTLRSEVLENQGDVAWDDEAGSYIWSLAQVAQRHGVQALGLYEPDGATLHHWTVDDVKAHVSSRHPVIAQVRYRYLPRRADSGYYGDHYIVLTGLLGNNLLYDDPIGGPVEGPGWDRVLTPEQLARAMDASDTRYAYAAFALTK
jgi:Peptidase_C39 like family